MSDPVWRWVTGDRRKRLGRPFRIIDEISFGGSGHDDRYHIEYLDGNKRKAKHESVLKDAVLVGARKEN